MTPVRTDFEVCRRENDLLPRGLAAEANDSFMVRVFLQPPNTRLRPNTISSKADSVVL